MEKNQESGVEQSIEEKDLKAKEREAKLTTETYVSLYYHYPLNYSCQQLLSNII